MQIEAIIVAGIILVSIPFFIKAHLYRKVAKEGREIIEDAINEENPYLLKFEVEGLGVKYGEEIQGYYNSRFSYSARSKALMYLKNSYIKGYFITDTGVSYPVHRVIKAWIEEKKCK